MTVTMARDCADGPVAPRSVLVRALGQPQSGTSLQRLDAQDMASGTWNRAQKPPQYLVSELEVGGRFEPELIDMNL